MTLDLEAIRKRNEAAGIVDVNLLLAEVERLQKLVPPKDALVLLPGNELAPAVRFVYGRDLKIVTKGVGLGQMRQFRENVARVYVEWKP